MKRFSVSQQLLDTILKYLAARPYQEVFKLIEEIQKDAQEIKEEEKEEPEDKPE